MLFLTSKTSFCFSSRGRGSDANVVNLSISEGLNIEYFRVRSIDLCQSSMIKKYNEVFWAYRRSRFWLVVSNAPRATRGPSNRISAGPRSMGRTLSPLWDWQRTPDLVLGTTVFLAPIPTVMGRALGATFIALSFGYNWNQGQDLNSKTVWVRLICARLRAPRREQIFRKGF